VRAAHQHRALRRSATGASIVSAIPPTLRIRSELTGGWHVLTLSGELDLASAGVLDTAIAELCTDGAERITLELSELEFMDSTGLRSVLVGQELCEVNGCELMIGELSPQVRRLFEVSGVGEKLSYRADLAEDA
jgi:anti-sigma B factor antagonist